MTQQLKKNKNHIVFRIYKNRLFVVDEVVNNLSMANFLINKLQIDAKLQTIRQVKGNIYISTFILNQYTYQQLMVFRECAIDILCDESNNQQYIKKAISKLKFICFFERFKKHDCLTFMEGCICMKTFIGYELYLVDCQNGGYSMANKCLLNNNIKGFLYKQYTNNETHFVFSVFKVLKFKEEDLMNAVYELKNTFYILNKIQDFENANNYIEQTYGIKLRSDEDGKEETTDS